LSRGAGVVTGMDGFPRLPPIADADDALLDGGHLWIRELIDGTPFRFHLRESGVLAFGDDARTYDPDAVPLRLRHAARHVRERFDRAALRAGVDDAGSVTFLGVAVHRRRLDYDWARTPPFLGTDVRTGPEGRLLPPDAVERAYDRLGLAAVNAFERELRAADFDPASYAVPDSEWYDGPAAGVVIRDKTGGRAKLAGPVPDADAGADPAAPEASVGEILTDRRLDGLVDRLGGDAATVPFDDLYERAVDAVVRERRRFDRVEVAELRSAVADRVERYLPARR